MKCPKCDEVMQLKKKDESFDTSKNNKKYERLIYLCDVDDVWIRLETPKE